MDTNVRNESLLCSWSAVGLLCVCVCVSVSVCLQAVFLTWDLQDDRPVCVDVNNFGQAIQGHPQTILWIKWGNRLQGRGSSRYFDSLSRPLPVSDSYLSGASSSTSPLFGDLFRGLCVLENIQCTSVPRCLRTAVRLRKPEANDKFLLEHLGGPLLLTAYPFFMSPFFMSGYTMC